VAKDLPSELKRRDEDDGEEEEVAGEDEEAKQVVVVAAVDDDNTINAVSLAVAVAFFDPGKLVAAKSSARSSCPRRHEPAREAAARRMGLDRIDGRQTQRERRK